MKQKQKKRGRPVKNIIKLINAPAEAIAKSMYVGMKTQKKLKKNREFG